MRMNREVPTLHGQEDRTDSKRSSKFDVKFDKLQSNKLVVSQSSFSQEVSELSAQNLRNRSLTLRSNEVKELRTVTARTCRQYSTATNSEKELPRNTKSKSNCCKGFFRTCSCYGFHWNVAYEYLPPSMVDDYLDDPQKTAARFMQLNMASAAVLIAAVIGIEFLMPTTFSREVLISGAIVSFPVHYALAINGLLGFVNAFLILSLSCRGLLVTRVQQILYSTVIVPLFGLFCLFYTLGASIMFADKLEERMISELHQVGSSSTIWTGSQKFFECCGVISKTDWLWNHPFENKLNILFPVSCCKLTTGDGCTYEQANTGRNGCLDSEMDLILGISYSLMLLASFHFVLELFGWMQIAKLNFRQKFRREIFQTWIDDRCKSTPCELLSNITANRSGKSMPQKPIKRLIGHKSEPHLVQEKMLNAAEENQTTLIKCSSAAT